MALLVLAVIGCDAAGDPSAGSTEPTSALAAGGDHTCAVRGGTLFCWGKNQWGELGADATNACGPMATPCALRPQRTPHADLVEVATGWDHTCGRTAGRKVRCWGWSKYGQTGEPHPDEPAGRPTAAQLERVAQITAREEIACARLDGGGVHCCGMGNWDQLGDGVTKGMEAHRHEPVAVVGLSQALEVRVGGWHSCARLQDATVACWGDGVNGKLGHGATGSCWQEFAGTHPCSLAAAPVPGIAGVAALRSAPSTPARCAPIARSGAGAATAAASSATAR